MSTSLFYIRRDDFFEIYRYCEALSKRESKDYVPHIVMDFGKSEILTIGFTERSREINHEYIFGKPIIIQISKSFCDQIKQFRVLFEKEEVRLVLEELAEIDTRVAPGDARLVLVARD